jgi:hypothetical protein
MALSIVDGFERFFDGLGLMTGEGAITKRMVIGSLAGAFIISYFKPSSSFEAGRPRPWILLSNGKDELEPTYFPWYWAPVAGAIVGGVLI